MPFAQISLLLLFLFPLAYSPGPGNMFFAALGARFGLLASLPANFGYHAATFVVSFAIGAGFSLAFAPETAAFVLLQKLGALYVLWLAWRLFQSQNSPTLQHARPAGPVQGAILLLLNPKGYLIMALMFTQFPGGSLAQISAIAAVFTLNNAVAFLVWTVVGQTLARLFHSPQAARYLNTGFAACLGLVALLLILA